MKYSRDDANVWLAQCDSQKSEDFVQYTKDMIGTQITIEGNSGNAGRELPSFKNSG